MQTVRTTIRLRKDLLDQSKMIAIKRSTTMQKVINDALQIGMQRISDPAARRRLMKSIDEFRENLRGRKINVQQLIEDNKRELQERTDRILDNLEKK